MIEEPPKVGVGWIAELTSLAKQQSQHATIEIQTHKSKHKVLIEGTRKEVLTQRWQKMTSRIVVSSKCIAKTNTQILVDWQEFCMK